MISVIITVYNGEKYIRKCMDILINQTIGIQNMEIIIIDDVSTDSTAQILEEYTVRFPEFIQVFRNKVHSSITKCSNRNKAIGYATGEYILFHDQDDWYELNALEILEGYINEYPDLDYIEFDYYCFYSDHNTFELKRCKEDGFHVYEISNEQKRIEYAKEGILPGATAVWNKIYKKKFLIEKNIYHNDRENNTGFKDNFFSALLAINCEKIGKLDIPLYNYCVYMGSSSRDSKCNSVVQFERCKVGLVFYDECKKRGLLEKNYQMVEYLFCRTFLLKTFWKFLLQYDPIPIETMIMIQQEMRIKFPRYIDNEIMSDIMDLQIIFNILNHDWDMNYLLGIRKEVEERRKTYTKNNMYLI